MRSFVVLCTIVVVLLVYDKLTTFISVVGGIFGMVNVLLLPSIAHLKLVAKTNGQRMLDYFFIGFSCIMVILLPLTIIFS